MSKRERMREARRQGEPTFASFIPRPQVTRPPAPPPPPPTHGAGQGQQGQVNGQGQGGAKEGTKRRVAKDWRVTFDLNVRREEEVPKKKEEVVECWEDLSDGEGHRTNKPGLVITQDDLIGCERDKGSLGGDQGIVDDGVKIDQTTQNTGAENIDAPECVSDKVEGPVTEEASIPQKQTDLLADSDADGTDAAEYVGDQVEFPVIEEQRVCQKQTNLHVHFVDDNIAEVAAKEESQVIDIDDDDGRERIHREINPVHPMVFMADIKEETEPSDSGDDLLDVSIGEEDKTRFPSISDTEVSQNIGGDTDGSTTSSVGIEEDLQVGKDNETILEEAKTEFPITSEADSTLITEISDELSSGTSALSKDVEEVPSSRVQDDEGDDDEWETEPSGDSDDSAGGEKVETVDHEAKQGDDENWLTLDDICVVEPSTQEQEFDDGDDLLIKGDIEAVLMALMEDQEKTSPIPPSPEPSNTDLLSGINQPSMIIEEDRRSPSPVITEREMSPQVSIGYESRDRKPSSVCGSETESEGELVPCEDKCVGTADYTSDSGDETQDLTVSESVTVNDEEETPSSDAEEDDGKGESMPLSKEVGNVTPETPMLQVPGERTGDLTPSPDLPTEGKCIGNSESVKEKEKVNGKKSGKKKGKKNKRDAKTEQPATPVAVPGRPRLVRGRAWKEKTEKFKAEHGNPLDLSFGKELCESEVIEATSNLLTETYTEASLLTPSRCPSGTTVFTEHPCTACSSISGEFSESESLHGDCVCGEKRASDAGILPLVTEVKSCDGAPIEHISDAADGHVTTTHLLDNVVNVPGTTSVSETTTHNIISLTIDPVSSHDPVPTPDKVFSAISASTPDPGTTLDSAIILDFNPTPDPSVTLDSSLSLDPISPNIPVTAAEPTTAPNLVSSLDSVPTHDSVSTVYTVPAHEPVITLEPAPNEDSVTRHDPAVTFDPVLSIIIPDTTHTFTVPTQDIVSTSHSSLFTTHTPATTHTPPQVTVEVTAASEDEDDRPDLVKEVDEFFIVKTQTIESPSQVSTEFVVDSEDSSSLSQSENEGENDTPQPVTSAVIDFFPSRTSDKKNIKENLSSPISPAGVAETDSSAYSDASASSCVDTFFEPYDYEQSFPSLVGTRELSLIYSYDASTDSDLPSREKSFTSHNPPELESSGVVMVNVGERVEDSETPVSDKGEIVYEGPCRCGSDETTRTETVDMGSPEEGLGSDEQLYVPSLLEDSKNQSENNVEKNKVQQEEGALSSMDSSREDQSIESETNGKDIRSRINEIVGARLQRERGQPGASVSEGGSLALPQDHSLGRDESPLPGSSPASSSGVQGSDEMSPSRSRSRSPSREESISPDSAANIAPDAPEDNYPVQESDQVQVTPDKFERDALESLRALRFEGSVDSTPEKVNRVDCSFRTFRDMYQINPIYLTDSDDHEDHNESDTVVPGSASLSQDPDRSITVSSKSGRFKGIVQRWEVLQAQAVERQRHSGQTRELQRQVKALRQALEALTDRATLLAQPADLDSHEHLSHKLEEAKALQEEVRARKVEVSGINLAVHRFLTETGYSLAPLKDEVADLYRLWDEADRRVNSEVTRLQSVEATWKLWESQAEELSRALRQDSDTLRVLDAAIQTGGPLTDSVTASVEDVARLLNDRRKALPGKKVLLLQHTKTQGVDIQGTSSGDLEGSTQSLAFGSGDECLSDSGTSGYESCSSEELSERERRLAHLRRLARDLEASLNPDSQAWAAVCKTLSSAETELKGLQQHCRELVVRSAGTLDFAKTSPQLRRRIWSKDNKVGRNSRRVGTVSSRDASGRGNGRKGWMWRVVKAALPFQAALLLLFCVACLLEPNCCDHVNTLNLSFSPQLRYVHGPPPV